jgi:hypothetical protein
MDCILEDQNHGGKDAKILEVPSQIAYAMYVAMQGFRQGLEAALCDFRGSLFAHDQHPDEHLVHRLVCGGGLNEEIDPVELLPMLASVLHGLIHGMHEDTLPKKSAAAAKVALRKQT